MFGKEDYLMNDTFCQGLKMYLTDPTLYNRQIMNKMNDQMEFLN